MQLLRIRYYQVRRDLRIWFFLIIALVFYLSYTISEGNKNYAYALAVIAIAGMLSFHSSRRDRRFAAQQLRSGRSQMLIGYQLCALPVSLALLLQNHWLPALMIHALVVPIPFLAGHSSANKLNRITSRIDPSQFEYIAGIRSGFPVLILLLLLSIVLSPVKLFGLIPLFLLNVMILSFHNAFEPRILLNPAGVPAPQFLNQKITYLGKLLVLLNVPLLFINSIFNPDVLAVNIYFLLIFYFVSACSIYIKYAQYEPGGKLSFNIDSLVLMATIFLPYLLPLTLLIFINNRKKAKENLSLYFND